ncbi:MAG: ABC transporter ATP-binding protein [Micrococcaceae bacterium]
MDEERKRPKAKLKDLWRHLAVRKKTIWLIVFLSLIGAVASLAQPLLVQKAIDQVQQNGDKTHSYIIALSISVIVAGLLQAYQAYLLNVTAEDVVYDARKELVRKLLFLPINQYDARRKGDLVSRVGSDTTMLRSVVTSGALEAISAIMVFIGAVLGMLYLDPILTIAVAIIMSISTFITERIGKKIKPLSEYNQEKVGDVAAGVDRSISAIRTLRSTGAHPQETERIVESADEARNTGYKLAFFNSMMYPLTTFATQLSFLTVIGLGGYRVAEGQLKISSLVSFVLFLFMCITPLNQAIGGYYAVQTALGALGRINEIMDIPDEEQHDKVTSELPTRYDVCFDNVVFDYGDQKVLQGLSFTAHNGQTTAFVGPSGAGKTTLFSLIERFYDPSSGSVSIGGVDIRTIPRTDLRNMISYVEQSSPALSGSIRENLNLGSTASTDEDCIEVLNMVKLGHIVTTGKGLDNPIGENGTKLSGGERQRLAIARALVTKKPILLLDEPTASLDSRNERYLKEAIESIKGERTIMIIAHRLATVMDADQIVVVKAGQVDATGTHTSLYRKNELYRSLVDEQLIATTPQL